MVENYVDRRREGYVALGWQRFQEASREVSEAEASSRYREAFDLFTLADSVSFGNPKNPSASDKGRALVKTGLLYAAIAAEQYAQAI